MTIGEFINRVLAIENETDARRFFEEHVYFIQLQIDSGRWESPDDAETAARADIGWCFGEGMAPERIQMWARVCGAAHPVFGTEPPGSAAEALEQGKKWAKRR